MQMSPAVPVASVCPRCGADFQCGKELGMNRCWCAQLPRVLPVPDEPARCYCPACLKTLIDGATAKPPAQST